MPTNKELQKEVEETKARLDDMGKTVDSMAAFVEENSAKTENNFSRLFEILSKTPSMDATEHDANESGMSEVVDGPDGDPIIEHSRLKDVETPEAKNKLATEQFMHEQLTITISETSDKQADQVFDVAVNGRKQVFVRGVEYTVPRYIVETLARAKPVHFDNEEYTKSSGIHAVRNPSRRGLRYPFIVNHDPNPRGSAWLKSVLSQP